MKTLKFILKNDLYQKSFLLLIQVVIVVVAFIASFALRFDAGIPQAYWPVILSLLPPLIIIKLSVFWGMGLFAGWWRYISLPDVLVILKANLIASLAFIFYVVFIHHLGNIPRSVLLIDGILCFLMIGGIRVSTRIFRESNALNLKEKNSLQKRVLVVGAGAVGQTIIREIRQNPSLKMMVVGFVDSDPRRQRQRFQGLPVLGTRNDLGEICKKYHIDQVIIAQPALCHKELRSIVECCRKNKIESKILPTMGDIINEEVSVRHIRDVQLEDLLGRDPVRLDIKEIQEYLKGKRILVTGAGGSIGSEICRQVITFSPDCIVLFDNAETPLFHLEKELKEQFPGIELHPRLSDVRDRLAVEQVFAEFRPEVVFHAAAYKHVPMSEINPIEAVKNNVLGTRNLADTAHFFGVRNFVMVSTDKAVNPTNTMGASKRAAEIYVQTLAKKSPTNMVTVRFGNVLGSNGSVVPIFKAQIEKGGPVTVTHPEVTRFFMTIPEAVQLVLQAGNMGKGGEIFLLDMGEPVKIVRLAEEMIRLSGLRAYEDIDIVFTGLRPGEKLYEELLLAGEGVMPTNHEKIRVAQATCHDSATLDRQLERLYQATRKMDKEAVLKTLREIVPEYQPNQSSSMPSQCFKPALAGPKQAPVILAWKS
jgi:FlaA1/EpsC-like NDP-sugar epimerase